jgi:putative transposase
MNFSINLPAGATIEYDDAAYIFRQELPGGRLLFTNTRTGGDLQVPDAETGGYQLPDEAWFNDMLRQGRLRVHSAKTHSAIRNVARAQQYTPEEIQAQDKKAALRHFVCTELDAAGVPRGVKAIAAYLAKLWKDAEVAARFAKVTEGPPSASTVKDWMRKRGNRGDRRWADMRQLTGRIGEGKVHYELREPLFQRALSTYTNRGRKISDGYADHQADVKKLNESRGPDEHLTAVSYETFRRMVRALEERKTLSAKFGKRFVQSRWLGGGQPLTANHIFEIVMFDHTPIDMIFLVDAERGVIAGHPHLGLMVDLYSRCILHDEISFNDPTMCDIGRALRGANTPKEVLPYYASDYPVMEKLYGKPVEVYFDNALYQIARGVEDAFSDVGVDVCYVGVDEPTQKAVVERLMKRFKELLVEKLPGSTYDIPGMREAGYDPTKHVALTIKEFRALLKEAIALYHITAHSGLGGRTPLAMYKKGLALGRHIIPHDQMDQLRRAVGNVKYEVTLTKDGIELFGGLKYTHREVVPALLDDLACLEARRGRPKTPKALVKVKYDDLDISTIEVWNQRTKTYQTLQCTNPDYADGMPLWLHDRIRQNAKDEALAFNTKADQLAARSRYNSLILEICPEMAEREARILAKLADDPALREKGKVEVLTQKVRPSPSGMESEIPNDMPAKTRVDAMYVPPRSSRGTPARDVRDAGGKRKAKAKSSADPQVAAKDKAAGGTSTAPTARKRGLSW